MNGHEWHDIYGFEGLGHVRALRTILTRNIPRLLPKIDTLIRLAVADFYDAHHGPVQPDGEVPSTISVDNLGRHFNRLTWPSRV